MPARERVPLKAMIAAYKELGSVHAVGRKFGIRGSSVHERLVRHGVDCSANSGRFSRADIKALRDHYKGPEINLASLASSLQRSYASIACKADDLGLTSRRGTQIKRRETLLKMSHNTREWIKKLGHPKGMLGKHHSELTKHQLSEIGQGRSVSPEVVRRILKTRLERYGTLAPAGGRKGCSWKQGWREISGRKIFFRSRWEFNYALYLEFLRAQGEVVSWEHEPETFWFEKIKRGCRSYLPDFKVTFRDGRTEFHEVKGWMDERSKTKLRRMGKYHPSVVVKVIDAKWFKVVAPQIRGLIKTWEH